MYKIRGADQKEYGPVPAEVVRQWISERRAGPQTLVQAEGGAWLPLSQFPEFADVLAGIRPLATPPPVAASAPSADVAGPRSTGLAIASFVLGIVSFLCLGLITGIPAIIMGHMARRRVRTMPHRYGGGGLAIAGLVLGYLSLFTTFILAGLLLPALAKAKSGAQRAVCLRQLKQIGVAARIWASDHGDALPPDFLTMSNELASPKVLTCPSDPDKKANLSWTTFRAEDVTYEFLAPGASIGDGQKTIAFQCPIHQSVGYADGSAEGRSRQRETF